jgi:hypothetical protein
VAIPSFFSTHNATCPCASCGDYEARWHAQFDATVDALPDEIDALLDDMLTAAIAGAVTVGGYVGDPEDLYPHALAALDAVWANRIMRLR